MRLTVNLPDQLGKQVKITALNEGTSISKLVAEAVNHYLLERKKKLLGKKVLDLVGRGYVAEEALNTVEEGRLDDRP